MAVENRMILWFEECCHNILAENVDDALKMAESESEACKKFLRVNAINWSPKFILLRITIKERLKIAISDRIPLERIEKIVLYDADDNKIQLISEESIEAGFWESVNDLLVCPNGILKKDVNLRKQYDQSAIQMADEIIRSCDSCSVKTWAERNDRFDSEDWTNNLLICIKGRSCNETRIESWVTALKARESCLGDLKWRIKFGPYSFTPVRT